MNYSKLTIENYRCFTEKQTLNLAQPAADKIGSGITYIVGTNNSGKTTIIESIWIKKGCCLSDSERQLSPPKFQLYDSAGLIKTVELIREEAFQFKETPTRQNNNDLFEIVSSRRQWDSVANGDSKSTDIISSSALGKTPRKPQSVDIAVMLKDIDLETSRHDSFTKLVQRVIPEFKSWAVGFDVQPYIKYISNDGISHRSDFLGDGVISVIRILAHIFEDRPTGLIIDEPELSLHPLAQKMLIKVIAEYAQKRQIIISTHSPYFVCWDYIKNGAKLNRVAKTGDTGSKIYSLQDPSDYSALVSGANWQQPFLMDEVAKEIFFANDNILFLEGQEDVGLLRDEFLIHNIHLFGYGVRGCDNFKVALKMAQDLGFKKVVIILDKGEKEDGILKDLNDVFGKDYRILQWNKNDIRDKVAITSTEKNGYFDKSGNKKPPEQLDDFDSKITKIKEYFQQTYEPI